MSLSDYKFVVIPKAEVTQQMVNYSTSNGVDTLGTIKIKTYIFFSTEHVILKVSKDNLKSKPFYDQYPQFDRVEDLRKSYPVA